MMYDDGYDDDGKDGAGGDIDSDDSGSGGG